MHDKSLKSIVDHVFGNVISSIRQKGFFFYARFNANHSAINFLFKEIYDPIKIRIISSGKLYKPLFRLTNAGLKRRMNVIAKK